MTDIATPQRCGLVAVLGAPNAGKSTLVNALVGQKVAIVSPKAQTTRVRLMGVAIEGDTQLLLVDTPGIFEPKRRLDRAMVQAAWGGAEGADVLALVVDAKGGLGSKVTTIAEAIKDRREPKYLILNKVDLADKGKLLLHAEKLTGMVQFDEVFFVSASTGDGLPELKAHLAARMPEGPWHFPEDQVSDATERSLASEVTNAPTDRLKSTSRSWSSARHNARSCSARAARGSRKSAGARVPNSAASWAARFISICT
jgi:GTP-binding protein Era